MFLLSSPAWTLALSLVIVMAQAWTLAPSWCLWVKFAIFYYTAQAWTLAPSMGVGIHAILSDANPGLFIDLRIIHFCLVVRRIHRCTTARTIRHRAACTRTSLFRFVFFRILTARYRQILNVRFPTFCFKIRP